MVDWVMAVLRLGWFTCALLVPALVCAAPMARVIVKLKVDSALVTESGGAQTQSLGGDQSVGAGRMQRLGVRAGVPLSHGRQLAPRLHVAQASAMSSAALAAHLSKQSDVEYAVVDELRFRRTVPNDPLYAESPSHPYVEAGQWYLRAPDSVTPAAINAEGAWTRTNGLASVSVAVLDTGVRSDHIDFVDKILGGYNMIANPVRAGGVPRSTNAEDTGDFLTRAQIDADPVSFPADDCSEDLTSSWHGMEVSGVVGAATNNGIGMAAVGGNTTIVPVRVLGKCGGYDSDIIAGMRWAAGLSVDGVSPAISQPRARVINLSLGSDAATCSLAYRDAVAAVNAVGVVVVAAAGNGSMGVESPASCDGVIAVAALRHVGTKTHYSSLGPQVAISAPGGNCVNATGSCLYPILTAANSGIQNPVSAADGGSSYRIVWGTSFAAPMVSGTVALMFAVRPELTPDAVKRVLVRSARPFPTSGAGDLLPCQASTTVEQPECYCTTSTCGAGMLDTAGAVAQAVSTGLAVVSVSPVAPTVGTRVTLTGSDSVPSAMGNRITSYQWELVDGGGIVSALSGDLASSSISATPSAAGSFLVRLTVVDDASEVAITEKTVVVSAVPSSGGGGGGALDSGVLMGGIVWLLLGSLARRRLVPVI